MNLSKDGCKRVPIWAHFFNVPLELWTDDGLSFIASAVGKPLHADASTSGFKRLNYARICIEIDIDDSLPNAFDIELEDGSCLEIQIAYNWVPKKCSVCKEFGHLTKNCKKASRLVWMPKSAPPGISPTPEDWQPVKSLDKDGSDKLSSPASFALLPRPALGPSKPLIPSGGFCCSPNFFDSLPSEDVLPSSISVEFSSLADQPPGGAGFCSNAPSSTDVPVPILPVLPVTPVAPLLCSSACVRDLPSPVLPASAPSSPTSSASSSPTAPSLLANKLVLVDEVDRLQGRMPKDKKKIRSSGHSRGKGSKHSK